MLWNLELCYQKSNFLLADVFLVTFVPLNYDSLRIWRSSKHTHTLINLIVGLWNSKHVSVGQTKATMHRVHVLQTIVPLREQESLYTMDRN